MKLIRNVFVVGSIAAASLAACSSNHGTIGSNGGTNPSVVGGQTDGTGSINQALEIGNNVFLNSLSYTCTGPATIPAGTIPINDAGSIEWVLGGITAGTGYVCTLTGYDTSGDYCSGTSSFSVIAGEITGGGATITCTVPTDANVGADVNTGAVGFDASVNLVTQGAYSCPGIENFTILPSEIAAGQTSALTVVEVGEQATVLGADGGPSTSNVLWTASPAGSAVFDGVLANTSTNPTPVFQCATPGTNVTITAQVTNYETTQTPSGPVTTNVCAGAFATTYTAVITCESGTGPAQCFPPAVTCPTSDGGTVCENVLTALDPNNCGACGVTCTGGATCTAVGGVDKCVAPAISACTSAPCATVAGANWVQCDKNANGVCDATQAVIISQDIDHGFATTASNKPSATSCYECLAGRTCIDSTSTTGADCDDLTGFVPGSSTYTLKQACLDSLNCLLGDPQTGTAGTTGTPNPAWVAGADCSNFSDGPANCFCGSAETDVTDCESADKVNAMTPPGTLGSSSPNGVCITTLLAGEGLTTGSSNTLIVGDLGNSTTGPGQAFLQLNCGGASNVPVACPTCFQ